MRIALTDKAAKQYKKLPQHIQEKARKAFANLLQNPHYPSLNTKKMQDVERFEARIDYHYRFTYEVETEQITIRTIGQHDEGLGKK